MTSISDEQLALSLKEVAEKARGLVNTSVEDMQSGLWSYTTHEHLRVLYAGLMIVTRRKEKTKVMILKRKIKQLEKAGVKLL